MAGSDPSDQEVLSVIASVVPLARPAMARRVSAVVAFDRYMLTPVDAKTASCVGSKPAASSSAGHDWPDSNSMGTSVGNG
ncbi:hypothetical protein [Amycolatopsis sp. DSM 110486]|uniref:hypothetical protein n=1 Tax=Amycolatopsis sp. DSM 110486 TaxID=2865832 RepID=UPI00351D3637